MNIILEKNGLIGISLVGFIKTCNTVVLTFTVFSTLCTDIAS